MRAHNVSAKTAAHMTLAETAVFQAMQTFKRQADDCVTSLYAYLTLHAVIGKSKPIRDRINENALFWGTTLYARTAGSRWRDGPRRRSG